MFLISAVVAVVALVSVLFIKQKPLGRTVDIQPAPEAESTTPELASLHKG